MWPVMAPPFPLLYTEGSFFSPVRHHHPDAKQTLPNLRSVAKSFFSVRETFNVQLTFCSSEFGKEYLGPGMERKQGVTSVAHSAGGWVHIYVCEKNQNRQGECV